MHPFTRWIALALALAGAPAWASLTSTFGFGCITPTTTSNLAGACQAGRSQLFLDVSDTADPGQVLFTFRNAGPVASSLTDLYFADGALLGIDAIINGPSGVTFRRDAAPFVTTAGFSAESAPPVQANGVNPGEWVQILFGLKPNKTYASVLDALALGGAPGGLRVGVHVQGYTTLGNVSAAFVNDPAIALTPVPLPAAGGLLAAALLFAPRLARRRL